MAQLSWSLIALDNLQAITDYIATDSTVYAAVFVQRVFDAALRQQLPDEPWNVR